MDIIAEIRKSNKFYYIIVGVVSFVSLVFLPFVGSTIGLGLSIPDTVAGWLVFIGVRIAVAIINVIIFNSFVSQAKINIKDDPDYMKAWLIYNTKVTKERQPRSPRKYFRTVYGGKGVSIFASSILAATVLTQCILTWDIVSFLSYLFTIGFGIIFGLLQMKETENYWTLEFVDYVQQESLNSAKIGVLTDTPINNTNEQEKCENGLEIGQIQEIKE